MNAPCPICAAAATAAFTVDGFSVRCCPACGHGFADTRVPVDHVARTYADDYFTGGGAGYADYIAEAALLRRYGRFYGRLLARETDGTHGRTLLDVGAAAGFVAAGLRDEGWLVSCVEPNASMRAYGRDRLALAYCGETLDDVAAGASFDAITLVQVVGHVPDPHAAFRVLARTAVPGGLLAVETWNAASKTARALGRRWHEYSPPSVLHYFTSTSLDALASAHGFTRVAHGRPRKGIGLGHAASLALGKVGCVELGRRVARALDRAAPGAALPYPFDDVFYALYRRAGV
ncbi:MAG: hypothetical protein NVS2B8_15260 [Vulcanimicrobiaceae bacterium]